MNATPHQPQPHTDGEWIDTNGVPRCPACGGETERYDFDPLGCACECRYAADNSFLGYRCVGECIYDQPHTDGIPEDIMSVAAELANATIRNYERNERANVARDAIAKAILYERERCAGIAKAWKGHPVDFHFVGKQIAAAILSPSTTQSHDGEIE